MNFVIKADDMLIEEIKAYYNKDIDDINNVPHTKFVATNKEYKVIVFNSNKVMFQGKDAKNQADIWNTLTSQEIVKTEVNKGKNQPYSSMKYDDYIGSDEVGTGDYFGPVVVCAAYINRQLLDSIKHLNIRDSKEYTDEKIIELARELKNLVPHYVYVLHNEKYNQNQPNNNMNQIKAKMHNYAITQVLKMINKKVTIIVDQFCQPKTYYSYLINTKYIVQNIVFETKAENKYVGVAIASILARASFLEAMDTLSKKVNTQLLKGASNHVDAQAASLVNQYGIEVLNKIAKVHFKNTDKVKEILKQKEI
jgi:ribonuclease HIII